MNTRTHILAWILFVTTILLWMGVLLFALHILDMGAAREANKTAQNNTVASQGTDAVVYATTNETKAQRQELDGFITVDPITLTKLLTTAAQSIGTRVTITSAGLAGKVSIASMPKDSAPKIFSFATDSQGSFSSLIHTAELFETLPAISSIQQLDLTQINQSTDVSKNGTKALDSMWHMNAQIQMLTTAAISS